MTSELNGPSTSIKAELNRTSMHIWVAYLGRKLRPLGVWEGVKLYGFMDGVVKNSDFIRHWSDVVG